MGRMRLMGFVPSVPFVPFLLQCCFINRKGLLCETFNSFGERFMQAAARLDNPSSEDVYALLKSEQEKWQIERTAHVDSIAKTMGNGYLPFRVYCSQPAEKVWAHALSELGQWPSDLYKKTNKWIAKAKEEGGIVVVELGCGNGRDIRPLLKMGWQVHAADSCGFAIQKCQQTFAASIDNGSLVLSQTIMEEYVFPENITMVYAADTLSHCEPLKLQSLLGKINQALCPRGYFVGNFQTKAKDLFSETSQRAIFKSFWLATERFSSASMAKKLLEDAHFEVVRASERTLESGDLYYDFVARKQA